MHNERVFTCQHYLDENNHRDLLIGIAYMESIVAPLEMNDFQKFMQIDLPPDGLEGTLKKRSSISC